MPPCAGCAPEFRALEALVPAYWIDLMERAVVGDEQAMAQLDGLAEREGSGAPLQ